jgi:hypothetical protein
MNRPFQTAPRAQSVAPDASSTTAFPAQAHATSCEQNLAHAHAQTDASHVCTTQHRACDGVRLFVWKKDRSGYTTIVAYNAWLDRVLPLVGGDLAALSKIARALSQRVTQRLGANWTQTVLGATEQFITAKHSAALAETERAEAQAAAENNSQWGE